MDRSLVRSCYHDDALDLHGSFSGGPDEYVDWAFRVIARHAATFHFIGNVLIELEGPRARAESYGISIHTSLSDEPERNLLIGFRYVDRFEKRGDAWRVAARVVVYDWVQPMGAAPAGSEAERFGPRTPIGGRAPDDPWYALLAELDG